MPEEKDNGKTGFERLNLSDFNDGDGQIAEKPVVPGQINTVALPDDDYSPVFFTKTISVPNVFVTDKVQNAITHEITLPANNFTDNNILKETQGNYAIDIPKPEIKYIPEIENPAPVKETKHVKEEFKPEINFTQGKSPNSDGTAHIENLVTINKSVIAKPELNKSEPDSYGVENPNPMAIGPEIKALPPDVKMKGLKKYLPEGLTIIFAVMIGFFAENVRDRINENKMAQQYAIALYTDLKADSAALSNYIKYGNSAATNAYTWVQLLSGSDPNREPSGKLYWVSLSAGANQKFIPHDASRHKLKNFASLRYFANPVFNQQLAKYNQLCQTLETLQSNDSGAYIDLIKAKGQRYDNALFNKYLEIVRSRLVMRKVNQADSILSQATALIAALKKQYNLGK